MQAVQQLGSGPNSLLGRGSRQFRALAKMVVTLYLASSSCKRERKKGRKGSGGLGFFPVQAAADLTKTMPMGSDGGRRQGSAWLARRAERSQSVNEWRP